MPILKYLHSKKHDLKALTSSHKTTVHLAADHGNLEAVKWLVQQGVNLNLTDTKGHNAYRYAKHEGHKDIATFLNDMAIVQQAKVSILTIIVSLKTGKTLIYINPIGTTSKIMDIYACTSIHNVRNSFTYMLLIHSFTLTSLRYRSTLRF